MIPLMLRVDLFNLLVLTAVPMLILGISDRTVLHVFGLLLVPSRVFHGEIQIDLLVLQEDPLLRIRHAVITVCIESFGDVLVERAKDLTLQLLPEDLAQVLEAHEVEVETTLDQLREGVEEGEQAREGQGCQAYFQDLRLGRFFWEQL